MKKYLINSTTVALGLTTALSASPTFATEQIAYALFGASGYEASCNVCHTNANINTADKGNLMSAAKSAYNQDKWGLSGLKTFVTAASTPVVPTCTNGQVLNAAKTACETPKPVVPTCTNGQVLNAAKTACETPKPVVPTCTNGQVLNAAKTACETPKPVVPTCTNGQVLNAAKTACETPKPVVPTCTGNMVLNQAKDACVALPAPIVTPKPTTDTTTTTTPATSTENTKPVLNKVATQWDITIGETLQIPLSVQDAEQDEFKMIASKAGTKFSEIYTDEKTQLPTVDFLLTPTAKDVNKILTFSFQAKETKTTQKLMSNKVSIRVRVWATNDRNEASVKGLKVSTSALKNGKLNLSGAIQFNNLLTTAERKKFIANKFDLTVTDPDGVILTTTPLTLRSNGNWSVSLPVKSVPCDIILEYQGQKAERSVVGCIAPVATITSATSTVVAKNDFLNNRFDDDDDHHENEHDDHNDHDD